MRSHIDCYMVSEKFVEGRKARTKKNEVAEILVVVYGGVVLANGVEIK